jgi:peptide deformylase
MLKKIVQKDNPVLRMVASPVSFKKIGDPEIKKVLSDMSSALADQADGVALAAPQIGIPLRIFIVSKKLFQDGAGDAVFINPELIKVSKKKVAMEEGCLSVRSIYGQTKRAPKATVQAIDEAGRRFSWNGSDLMAQIFQHEIDHLDGILFIDHATNLREQNHGN